MNDNIATSKSYFETLMRTANGVVASAIDQVAAELLSAYFSDKAIYIFGNGGSAATASHFACDLGKGVTKRLPSGTRRMRAIALTDNIPVMTAWANDSKYEDIFAEQLKTLVRPGDVVIGISASGKSPNVLNALRSGQLADATTIGFAGFDGGGMPRFCDHCVVVPSKNIEVIEDIHMAICHCLATVVRTALQQIAPDGITSGWQSTASLRSGVVCATVESQVRSPSTLAPIVGAGKPLTHVREQVEAD